MSLSIASKTDIVTYFYKLQSTNASVTSAATVDDMSINLSDIMDLLRKDGSKLIAFANCRNSCNCASDLGGGLLVSQSSQAKECDSVV